jgi:hypothetical protein
MGLAKCAHLGVLGGRLQGDSELPHLALQGQDLGRRRQHNEHQ